MNPQQEESMRRAHRSLTGASDGNDRSNSPPRQHELGLQQPGAKVDGGQRAFGTGGGSQDPTKAVDSQASEA